MATAAGAAGYAWPHFTPQGKIMTSLFFILRITLATMVTYIIATAILVENFLRYIFGNTEGFFVIVGALLASAVISGARSRFRSRRAKRST
jgi:hypothetical protein